MQVILNKTANAMAGARAPKFRTAAVTPKAKSTKTRVSLPRQRKTAALGTPIFSFLIGGALIVGWLNRGVYLKAESGLGYYLGIIGALSMLALLAYPMRKYIPWFRAGPVSLWFRIHMALGVIGPTLILYHANFSLGSLNSNVALWSMLLVAGSGLVGRFLYAKIHRGLYGKRAEARDLLTEASGFRHTLDSDIGEDLAAKIDALEKTVSQSAGGIVSAASKAISATARARRLSGRVRRRIRELARQANKKHDRERTAQLRMHISLSRRYFQRIEQAAELSFYERLFAAWHILHLPLFVLLIITALIHVVAVHLY